MQQNVEAAMKRGVLVGDLEGKAGMPVTYADHEATHNEWCNQSIGVFSVYTSSC